MVLGFWVFAPSVQDRTKSLGRLNTQDCDGPEDKEDEIVPSSLPCHVSQRVRPEWAVGVTPDGCLLSGRRVPKPLMSTNRVKPVCIKPLLEEQIKTK